MEDKNNSNDLAAAQQQQLLKQHQQTFQQQAAEAFSQGVADVFMAVEELRQSLPNHNNSNTTPTIISPRLVGQWQQQLDHILQILAHLQRWALDAAAAEAGEDRETTTDMHAHTIQKAVTVAHQVLTTCYSAYTEPTERTDHANNDNDDDDEIPLDEQRRNAQGAIARITELNLVFLGMLKETQAEIAATAVAQENVPSETAIVKAYVEYQRQVLRQRAKPAIAQLVQERRKGTFQQQQQQEGNHHQQSSSSVGVVVPGAMAVQDDDDDDDEYHDGKPQHQQQHQQHHAPVLTVVLGEAAALIHPLAAWMAHLPDPEQQQQQQQPLERSLHQLCRDSIRTLDDQAQSLAKTVSDWFWQDRPVDAWMQQSSQADAGTSCSLDESSLARLDALVEEMAYSCQVFERYQSLVASTGATTTTNGPVVVAQELLPEWTWKYGALERFLALQQWQAALAQAVPVTIVLGTEIRVPSVVEDAQYLSTRALERAATTRSLQAVATVAYAVCHDVWSTEVLQNYSASLEQSTTASAVYQALLDEMGCWSELVSDTEKGKKNDATSSNPLQSGGFASALLDALDDDIGPELQSPPKKTPMKAPSSGNFLTSLVADKEKMQQRQLDTLFCLLNGMHAASGASRALVTFLDDLLAADADYDGDDDDVVPVTNENQKATSMIQLAREELSRYSDTYQRLLTDRIEESLVRWCGSPTRSDDSGQQQQRAAPRKGAQSCCLRDLQAFFEHENYNLDGDSIGPAEADERLESKLIGPLRDSKFLHQLPDKCEGEVLQITSERVAAIVVDIVLESLWKDNGQAKKKFTDWGSLLLSKQSRLLQTYISTTMLQPSSTAQQQQHAPPPPPATSAAKLLQIWERLSQVVTVLQLEKPSDWLAYHSTSILSAEELSRTLTCRVDFSSDAIESVVSSVRITPATTTTAEGTSTAES